MSKRFWVGCLIGLIVASILAGIGLYWFVYRPAKDYVASFSRLGEIVEMDDEIANRSAFAPPEDGVLTASQVDRFVAVQRFVVQRMGLQLEGLRAKYEAVGKRFQQDRSALGLSELIEAWKDLSGVVVELKRVQVEALNQQGFSNEEYSWVRSSFYQAVGAEFVTVNLEKVVEAIRDQNPDLLKGEDIELPAAPEANTTLVEPYAGEASAWLAYAWLGL